MFCLIVISVSFFITYQGIKIADIFLEKIIIIFSNPKLDQKDSYDFYIKSEKTISLLILLYHHIAPVEKQNPYYVRPEIFKDQMAWIKQNNYNVIPLSQVIDALNGKGSLPIKPLVITFDDGVKNAYPVLKQYNFPATFFVKINIYNKTGGYNY